MSLFSFNKIISSRNLFSAWKTFSKGKRKRHDVMIFERNLEDNIFELHKSLKNKTYQHKRYSEFFVNDPKRRHIHKATVRDRIVHQILYDSLYEIFDNTFIFDSYSCRVGKGTHKGVKRLANFTRKVSHSYTRECWALKLDIEKFFASVDHSILLKLIESKVRDKDILWLTASIIDSFETEKGKGIPLGNLTSQVFANIYLNELDQFVKHSLKVKYYLRYADDFLILSNTSYDFPLLTSRLGNFVQNTLKLTLHPNKIILRKFAWGIDFLGYIVLPHRVILPRTKTKRRMLRKLGITMQDYYKGDIEEFKVKQTIQSYLGYLSHAKTFNMLTRLKNEGLLT